MVVRGHALECAAWWAVTNECEWIRVSVSRTFSEPERKHQTRHPFVLFPTEVVPVRATSVRPNQTDHTSTPNRLSFLTHTHTRVNHSSQPTTTRIKHFVFTDAYRWLDAGSFSSSATTSAWPSDRARSSGDARSSYPPPVSAPLLPDPGSVTIKNKP
jgi:hypothetical protein